MFFGIPSNKVILGNTEEISENIASQIITRMCVYINILEYQYLSDGKAILLEVLRIQDGHCTYLNFPNLTFYSLTEVVLQLLKFI